MLYCVYTTNFRAISIVIKQLARLVPYKFDIWNNAKIVITLKSRQCKRTFSVFFLRKFINNNNFVWFLYDTLRYGFYNRSFTHALRYHPAKSIRVEFGETLRRIRVYKPVCFLLELNGWIDIFYLIGNNMYKKFFFELHRFDSV